MIIEELKLKPLEWQAKVKNGKKNICERALSINDNEDFFMNFQQIKPHCFDVMIIVAVYTDYIKYWVMSSDEVKNNAYYSDSQHGRNHEKNEGQMPIKSSNIKEFEKYCCNIEEIKEKILKISPKKSKY